MSTLSPMLLARGDRVPLDERRWVLQPKWDGVRVLVSRRRDRTVWRSRHGADLSGLAPAVDDVLRELPDGTVLDGELVALGRRADGHVVQDFDRVRRAVFCGGADDGLCLAVWDVLRHARTDVRAERLQQRARVLDELLPESAGAVLRCPDLAPSPDVVKDLVATGWEGAVLKRRSAPYRCGERSSAWTKHKGRHETIAIVRALAEDERGARALVETETGRRSWAQDRASVDVGAEVRVHFARYDLDGSLRDARVVGGAGGR